MKETYCCNFSVCKVVNDNGVLMSSEKKAYYVNKYCNSPEQNWVNCKRYQVKQELGFCPEKLLPDSEITLEEIIRNFE